MTRHLRYANRAQNLPRWWRGLLVAASVLILCSCRGAGQLGFTPRSEVGAEAEAKSAAVDARTDARIDAPALPSPALPQDLPADLQSDTTHSSPDSESRATWNRSGDADQAARLLSSSRASASATTPTGNIAPVVHQESTAPGVNSPPFPGRGPEAWIPETLPPAASRAPLYAGQPWVPPGLAGPWPRDEYLYDGGDKPTSVTVDHDWNVRGLHQEDTIAHFDTIDGDTRVVASNRVPIYAPRFASVRRVSGVLVNRGREHSYGVERPTEIQRFEDWQVAETTLQRQQIEGQLGTKSASTFLDRTQGLGVNNVQNARGFANHFLAYEDFQIIRTGQFDNTEKARLAGSIDAALVWESKQAVQVVFDGAPAAVSRGATRVQSADVYERIPGHPQLRIVKVASKQNAKPGEIIDFTLRFDNIGDELIGNVTILDNLTTRLEYIPDSAQCSLKSGFFTQENEGESLVLRWEITDPLPINQGGIIRFQCRVR